MALRPADAGMVAVALIAAIVAMFWVTYITPPHPCSIPVPPIILRTVSGSGELVFLTVYSTYYYAEGQPQAPVPDLRFELAEYHPGDDYSGPGTIIREGPLGSLNLSGDLQYHDMAAEASSVPGTTSSYCATRPPPPCSFASSIRTGTRLH